MATANLNEPTSASDGNIPYIGAAADDGTGNTLREAINRINARLRELYGSQNSSNVVQTPFIDGDNIKNDTIDSQHYAAGSVDEEHLNISNTAVDGYILSWNNTAGQFEWKEEFDGDITSIVAGSGLTGSSLDTDDATLNVGAGTGITVNADDIQIADGGVGTTQLADDAVGYAKLGVEFTTKATIPSDYDVDFATATIFTDTMDGNIDYDIENPSVGDVKTLVLTGDGTDRTITFTMSGSTDTDANIFKKMKGSDDFVFTSGALNLVQMIVVDDTANGEEIWYSNSVVAS